MAILGDKKRLSCASGGTLAMSMHGTMAARGSPGLTGSNSCGGRFVYIITFSLDDLETSDCYIRFVKIKVDRLIVSESLGLYPTDQSYTLDMPSQL